MEDFKESAVLCLLSSIEKSLCLLLDKYLQSGLQNSDFENVQQKLWQVKLATNEALSEEIQASLDKVISNIIRLGKIPDVNDSDVPESTTINYEVCISNAEYSFHMLLILIKELSVQKQVVSQNANWLQNAVIIPSIVFCASHEKVSPWSNEKTCNYSKDLTEAVLNLTNCEHVDQLYEGGGGVFPDGVAKTLMTSFMPQLTKETWKHNTATIKSFASCLTKIKHPHLGNLLTEVLPPALLFVDDYVLENKILGIRCLQHIIENVAPAELKWYGRAEVVYSALEHLMYTIEADLIYALHPCLLRILSVVEDDPTKPSNVSKVSRYDKVLGKILTDMEFEQRLVIRRAFSQCISSFIEKLGINVVRHIKHLLRVISEYLQVCDGTEEHARINMLLALRSLIITAWPRIPHHMVPILKTLVKLIYDIHSNSALIGQKERSELTQLAAENLNLLKKLDPKQFQSLFEPLLDVSREIPGREFLDTVEVST